MINVTALYKDIDTLKQQVLAKEQARAEEELKRIDAENKYSRNMLHYARLMKKTCGGKITERQSLVLAGLDVLDIIELREAAIDVMQTAVRRNERMCWVTESITELQRLRDILTKIGAL